WSAVAGVKQRSRVVTAVSDGRGSERVERRSLDGTDVATAEDAPERRGVTAAVGMAIGVEDGAGASGERGEAVELEVAVDDDAIAHVPAETLPDLSEDGRPDLPVVVLVGVRPVIEAFIGQTEVEPARGVPSPRASVPSPREPCAGRAHRGGRRRG